MARLKLRRLDLTVITQDGPFGTTMDFEDGLNVLRAENSSGKSTLMQSILYALGLEGALAPGKRVPLTPAVLEELETPDGRLLPVLESQVMVEIENGDGAVITVQRWIKHATVRRELVTVWEGTKLTDPGQHARRSEFYVGFEGSAQRERGFHTRLAEFIGWQLPLVQRYDGTESPLYMEVIVPLLFVEQKHGWGGVLANMPDHLRIRDPGARAIEFILDLEASARAKRREELQEDESRIAREWAANVHTFRDRSEGIGTVLEGMPINPTPQWPMQVEPQLRVAATDGWLTLAETIAAHRDELRRLDEEEIPRVEEAAGAIQEELQGLERDYSIVSSASSQLLRETRIEREQIEALDRRLEALAEDRKRNIDARRLRDLGGLSEVADDAPHCPTCHQQLSGTLIDLPHSAHVMTLDDNIGLIDEETGIFRAMRKDADRVLAAKRQRVIALRKRVTDLQRQIRSAKRDLVANGKAPSEATIARRVRLEDRIEDLERIEADYTDLSERLAALSKDYRVVRGEMERLKSEGQSIRDEEKLAALQRLVRDQLTIYGFQSLRPESIEISRTRYVPVREGFNLGHDISASDMVRLIWSFLLGLLEVGRDHENEHPGILMFDEPRQQDAAEVSFRELLRRAANAGKFGQQVIFATSEEPDNLRSMLNGVEHEARFFNGWILDRRSD
jgi:AAA domain